MQALEGTGLMGLLVAVLLGLRHATDPDHLTAAQKEAFADACNDLLPQMLGKNYDATRVRPFAGISGWGDDGKFAYCDVAAIDDTSMLGAGSLIARR